MLFPVPHSPEWELVGLGKLTLGESPFLADSANIDRLYDLSLAVAAFRESDSVLNPRRDLVECALHLSFPYSLNWTSRRSTSFFSLFRSALVRLSFSPLPNTVSNVTGMSSPP